MNLVKNLTPELEKAEAKDRFYQIEGTIVRLLAPHYYSRPFIYEKKGWGEIARVEVTQDGTPADMRAPSRRKRVRKGESEIRSDKCWTFKTEKRKIGGDRIMIPWGTNWGIFKNALRRSLIAQKKQRYSTPPLELMKVYPTWLDTGKRPCESMKNDKVPEVVLEKRHTQGGDVRVETFFDYIEDRPFKCFVEVDSENPIGEEQFVAFVKTLNTLDSIGPSKRGSVKIEKVARVELSKDEIEKMEKGEPVEPVVY